jgi:hypothetical protein
MIINYPRKYTDFNRLFLNYLLKIMHSFHQEINNRSKLFSGI